MECSPDRIHADIDGELAPSLRAEFEQHLASCPTCAEARAQLLDLRASVRANAPYFRASDRLRQSIRSIETPAGRPAPTQWRWLAIAATVLLALSLGWNVVKLAHHQPDLTAEMVLSDHIRSLMGTHLLDVPSTDQHTVKPWFNGKLDFSPDVKDFVAEGFPLIGGRLEYLDGRAVAALVYQRRKHVISLFTWPSDRESAPETEVSRNGFHALHWTSGDMTYWAVSDVALTDLEEFEKLYRK